MANSIASPRSLTKDTLMTLLRTVQSTVLSVAVVATMALVVAAPSPASAAAPSGARAGKARAVAPSFANEVLRLTNLERTKRGLRPLARAQCTERASARWARTMAAKRKLRHQSLRKVARACRSGLVGENIAMGRPLSPAQVVRMWMHSSGHRANILRPSFGHLGVGAYQSTRSGAIYVVQSFRA